MNEIKQTFDYSQFDELTAHKLKKAEKEINENRLKIGKAIYKTGLLIAIENEFLPIVRAGVKKLGLQNIDFQEILICVGIFLESETYGK